MPKINTINDFTTAVHTALAAAFPECCVEITSVTKTMECARTVLLSRQKIKQSFLHSIWSRILKKFSPENAGRSHQTDHQQLRGCIILYGNRY